MPRRTKWVTYIYGNYATYFEVARVETLRSLGINYKEMEDKGVMLPVLSYSTKFLNQLITMKN